MKVLAVNGSHRKGKNTAEMLKAVLDGAAELGAETELLELMDYQIKECIACNKCLSKAECTIQDDDMAELSAKLVAADGIVFGSPVYFANVTGRLKDFIDRSRPLHLVQNALDGKVGGAVVHAGLRNGGQELALAILHTYLLGQGMVVASDRGAQDALVNGGAMGSMFSAFSQGKMSFFKNVSLDEAAMISSRALGRQMVRLAQKLPKEREQ
ncbi:MAG: flavodoxin family protein [Dethiobacter sp.]|nr:flavodoxin family protein [Dethiobacter sp.]MBS3897413.1 flavodoxin family protein [Dethiobacter sp.]